MKTQLSFTILSNVTLATYFSKLLKETFGDILVRVNYIRYGEHNEVQAIEEIRKSDFIVIWMNYEELVCEFEQIDNEAIIQQINEINNDLISNINQIHKNRIIWILYEDYYRFNSIIMGNEYDGLIDYINLNIYEKYNREISFIDLKSIIAQVGIQQTYDFKNKYRWNLPYSKDLIAKVVLQIHKHFLILNNYSKKCLVLDCDNVLWNGILAEDGIENIKLGHSGLGKYNYDFQKFIMELYNHGVIITICTKNDIDDVLRVFREHTGMVIHEEQIAVFKANWNNKVDNIIDISKELNIGLDSMVFVDDSDFEIQAVKHMIPEVTTILFTENCYDKFECFNLKRYVQMEDIIKRNRTYQTNNLRNELKKNSTSFTQYLNALDMKIDIHKVVLSEISRISELTLRTNKITNGRRYTVEELISLMKSDHYKLYAVYLADCFTDLGLVGAIGIDGDVLDLISISCRAAGRNIEERLFQFALNNEVNKVTMFSTDKNESFTHKIEKCFEFVIQK